MDTFGSDTKASKIEYVKNFNQFHPSVKYKAELPFGAVFLEEDAFSFVFRDPEIDEIYHAMQCKDQTHVHDDVDISQYNSIDDLVIPKHAYRVAFLNTLETSKIQPTEKLTKYFNYFYGNDPSRWQGKVPGFSTITYQNLYEDIDIKVFSSGSSMKYDIVIKPGADVNDVAFQYDGLDDMYIKDGHLFLQTSVGVFQEVAPFTYQLIDGELTTLPSAYVLNDNIITFEVDDSNADKTKEIIIDPILVGATYSGSTTTNYGWSAAYDTEGNIYSGGQCFGDGFPATLGAFQEVFNPGGGGYYGGVDDCITKFNPDGTAQIYATYLGGQGSDLPNSLFVADNNELIAFGSTTSDNFPVDDNAYQDMLNVAGGYGYYYGNGDTYITRFTEDGSDIVGSTFFGGTGYEPSDSRGDITVAENNDVIVTFGTTSNDMPTNSSSFQQNLSGGGDAFIARFNANLSTLIWGSYYGGDATESAYNMHLDRDGNIYMTGPTNSSDLPTTAGAYQETSLDQSASYLAHIAGDGSSILASTYISHASAGGGYFYSGVRSYFVDQDNEDNVWIFGSAPADYPVDPPTLYNNPNSGQFIAELNSSLTTMYKSTVFGTGGGYSDMTPSAFMVDVCNNVYACGYGPSGCDMPVTPDAYSSCAPGSSGSFHFIVLDSTMTELKYGTYYGSTGWDHNDGGSSRFDKRGIVYQAVCTSSSDGPTTPGAYSTDDNGGYDVYVYKFDFEQVGLSAVAEALPATEGCAPFDVQFDNLGYGGLTYYWDFGDGSPVSNEEAPSHLYPNPGEYEVQLIAEDPTTCLITDTSYTIIYVSTGQVEADFTTQTVGDCNDLEVIFYNESLFASDYIWDFGDGSPTSTEENPVYQYTAPGSYTITLIGTDVDGCNLPDTITYEIEYSNQLQIAADFEFDPQPTCEELVVEFQNTSDLGDTYEWEFGDGMTSTDENPTHTYTETGLYNVTLLVTDSNGCAAPNLINYQVDYTWDASNMAASFTSVEDNQCDFLDAEFTNTSIQGDTFEWDFGDGTPTSNLENPSHTYTSPGSYLVTLTVSDSQGCFNDAIETYQISYEGPIEALLVIPDLDSCLDAPVQFNTESIAQTYNWDFGDGEVSTLQNPQHQYSAEGVYNVQLTIIDSASCNIMSQTDASVEIIGEPDASFTVVDTLVELNQEIEINFPNANNVAAYTWNFGDGTEKENDVSPFHFFNQEGEFEVCLDVVTSNGCVNQSCRMIYVNTESGIGVPNAFSPNSDAANDVLYVRGYNIEWLNFKLFNRWGELVFETEDLSVGWDGNINGKPHEMDVFAYVLNARLMDGRLISNQTGNVTLLR